MAGGNYHDENIKIYPNILSNSKNHPDSSIRGVIKGYGPSGSDRHYLYKRVDHRAWRRANILEALRRGLIEKDPGDAP